MLDLTFLLRRVPVLQIIHSCKYWPSVLALSPNRARESIIGRRATGAKEVDRTRVDEPTAVHCAIASWSRWQRTGKASPFRTPSPQPGSEQMLYREPSVSYNEAKETKQVNTRDGEGGEEGEKESARERGGGVRERYGESELERNEERRRRRDSK